MGCYFWGFKFLWFGKLRFRGFIFLWHTYSNHLVSYGTKSTKFWTLQKLPTIQYIVNLYLVTYISYVLKQLNNGWVEEVVPTAISLKRLDNRIKQIVLDDVAAILLVLQSNNATAEPQCSCMDGIEFHINKQSWGHY